MAPLNIIQFSLITQKLKDIKEIVWNARILEFCGLSWKKTTTLDERPYACRNQTLGHSGGWI